MLSRDFSGGGGARGTSRERLTEDQKQELRQMRKRQRVEHRKRKLIKLDEDGVSGQDGVDVGMIFNGYFRERRVEGRRALWVLI